MKFNRYAKAATAILGLLVVAIGILAGAAPFIGKRLILPGLLQNDPRAILKEDGTFEIVHLKLPDGTKIVGQFGKANDRTANSRVTTVMFFYGVSQTLAAPADQKVFSAFRDMGFNVFIPEFPGYGMSEGKPSETIFYETADAALTYLRSRVDVDPLRIIAAGRSLGAATAVDLASRQKLAGLIGVGTFTTAADTLCHSLWWLPRWLAQSATSECRFDNLSKIKAVSCPILLVYGGRDTVVPLWMANALSAAASSPVAHHYIEYSRHNDLWKSSAYGLDSVVKQWIEAIEVRSAEK